MSLFAVLLVLVAVITSVTASKGFADPDSPTDILTRYKALSHQAEVASEQATGARVDYEKKLKLQHTADAKVAAANKVVADIATKTASLQSGIDALVRANYQGARTNRLFALLVSNSPQQILDQMSTLELINRDTVSTMANFRDAKVAAQRAAKNASTVSKAAADATAKAEKVRVDLQKHLMDLQMQIARVKALYDSLTGAQHQALIGPSIPFDASLIPRGTSPESIAVQAALSRIGDPYVWGATGPGQFDCSGLMVWAYEQAGRILPRTSNAQLDSGSPVSRADLKPGDLIIYYPDATHVGMYVGDGYVIHASTFGVPVAVVPIDQAGPYNSARRY